MIPRIRLITLRNCLTAPMTPVSPMTRMAPIALMATMVIGGMAGLPSPVLAANLSESEQAIVDRANQGLSQIEKERAALRQASSRREQACLQKFLSADCLEDLRQSHAAASRDLDLAAESLREQIREAQARARARARGVQRAP